MDVNNPPIEDEFYGEEGEEFAVPPPQRSQFRVDLPQPGTYTIKFPADCSDVCEDFEASGVGKRLRAKFIEEKALMFHAAGQALAVPVSVVFNNIPKTAWLANNTQITVPGGDLDYLFAACEVTPERRSRNAYIAAVEQCAGKSILGDWIFNAYCNPKKEASFKQADGSITKGPGCGQSYEMKARAVKTGKRAGEQILAIPQFEDGTLAQRFECTCKAMVYVKGELRSLRKAGR
jgi:hypothetical protein